jgi:hypothetical protein
MFEVNEVLDTIRESADPHVLILHGIVIDTAMHDSISVTVIATNFNQHETADASLGTLTDTTGIKSSMLPYSEFKMLTRNTINQNVRDATFADMPKDDPVDSLSLRSSLLGNTDLKTPAYLRNAKITLGKE